MKTLRELLAEATPRPWEWREDGDWAGDPTGCLWSATGRGLYDQPPGMLMEPVGYETETIRMRREDAELIVAAVNALPALLDMAEAARDFVLRFGVYRDDCIAAHVWGAPDETLWQGTEALRAALGEARE